jgi:hypothetical protein
MRNAFLYSLPIAIVAVAGCGSEPKEQATRSDLKRDLTLVSRPRETAVASAVELGRPLSQTGTTTSLHRVARPGRAHRSTASSPKPAPPAPATRPVIADIPAPSPASQRTSAPAIPADSHELPPGKTVTVIPVSSGPSTAGGGREPDDIPMRGTGGSGMGGSGMGGGGSGMGGGRCPGRDIPGIGIASRPRGVLY